MTCIAPILPSVRVVCWNIERGYQPIAIAKQLTALRGDVYLLYELDRGVKRTAGVDMFRVLEEELNMPGHYVREFREIDSRWRSIIPWGGPGGGETGNAVFSRYSISDYRTVDLPTKPPLTYDRSTLLPELFEPREGCRKAQVFRINPHSHPITVVSAHLELMRSGWEHRRLQLEAALAGTPKTGLVLAGDFNNVEGVIGATVRRCPGGGEVAAIRSWLTRRNLHDPFNDTDATSGLFGIRAKIDWVASTQDLQVKNTEIVETDLSDHHCLVVDYFSP